MVGDQGTQQGVECDIRRGCSHVFGKWRPIKGVKEMRRARGFCWFRVCQWCGKMELLRAKP